MDTAKVEIIVITYNNASDISETMDSIKNQIYPQECVFTYVVDFGSTDETYDKLLQYDAYHLAVYKMNSGHNKKVMVAEATKLLMSNHFSGELAPYYMVLWGGDIIYPDFLTICTQKMLAAATKYPKRLVCEADIKMKCGSVKKQMTLFDNDRVFAGVKDCITYIDKGYDHYVGCFGDKPCTAFSKMNGIINGRYDWNSQIHIGCENTILYIRDVLLCLTERESDDDLEAILLRWESIMYRSRLYKNKWGKELHRDFESKAFRNVALYCLWRCRERYRELSPKQLEDCLSMAEIIDANIVETAEYVMTRNMLFR